MKKALLVISLLATIGVRAQLDYTLSYSTSAYTELSGATDISSDAWTSYYHARMPFTFEFFGRPYDTINIMANGSTTGIFFSSTGVDFIFFGAESYYPENNDPSMSPISFQVTGSTPDRILKVQFKNIYAVCQDTAEDYIVNNQVWLYEGSNKIEYHFGPNIITDLNVTDYFIGIIDYDNSPYLAIDSTSANPKLVRVFNAGDFEGIHSHPANGQVYTLTPSSNTGIANVTKPYTFASMPQGFMLNPGAAAHISLYDVAGRSIHEFDALENERSAYSLNDIATGIYLVKIEIGTQQFIEKIIIR